MKFGYETCAYYTKIRCKFFRQNMTRHKLIILSFFFLANFIDIISQIAIESLERRIYRDNKGRSCKSNSCNLGGINALLSQVLEVRLERASKPSTGGLYAEGLGNRLRGPKLQAAAASPGRHAHLGC